MSGFMSRKPTPAQLKENEKGKCPNLISARFATVGLFLAIVLAGAALSLLLSPPIGSLVFFASIIFGIFASEMFNNYFTTVKKIDKDPLDFLKQNTEEPPIKPNVRKIQNNFQQKVDKIKPSERSR